MRKGLIKAGLTIWVVGRTWLPDDNKTFLFTLVVCSYLIAAIISFVQHGDGSMLTTILSVVGAYVGLRTVKQKDRTLG